GLPSAAQIIWTVAASADCGAYGTVRATDSVADGAWRCRLLQQEVLGDFELRRPPRRARSRRARRSAHDSEARSAEESCRRRRDRHARLKGASMLGDAVDRREQLAHARDERDLGEFPVRAQAPVVMAQPGIAAHGAEHGHPERVAQAAIAERADAGTQRCVLAGVA